MSGYLRSRSFWVLVPLAAALVGCSSPSAEKTQSPPPKVSVSHPTTRTLVDEDDYNGWMRASATVEVRARVRGHIQKVAFKDGDMVKKDQLLFELDPRPFQSAIDQCLAQVKVYEAQKNAAEKEVARNRKLIKSAAVSQEELEKSEANLLSFDAQIAATMQEVAQHKLDLEFSRVTAPIAGRIGRAMLTVGNLVNAGGSDPLLTTIVAVDPVYVYFTIDERSLQRYQKNGTGGQNDSVRGQKIPFQFGLDTDEGYPHQGVLDFADNKVDSSTGTIEVRGVVANEKGTFIPGSRVRVRVPVSDKYSATLIPDTAINTDQDQKYLLVLDAKNVVTRSNVRLGRLLDDGMRVIRSAQPELKSDSWVIVEGMQRARLNYAVDPVQVPAPSQTASSK